jgi:hypothetical protein
MSNGKLKIVITDCDHPSVEIERKVLNENRLPRLYRRGTHLNRLLSVPVYREFALIPILTDGEFPLN